MQLFNGEMNSRFIIERGDAFERTHSVISNDFRFCSMLYALCSMCCYVWHVFKCAFSLHLNRKRSTGKIDAIDKDKA